MSETLEWHICNCCKRQVSEVDDYNGEMLCEDCFADKECSKQELITNDPIQTILVTGG